MQGTKPKLSRHFIRNMAPEVIHNYKVALEVLYSLGTHGVGVITQVRVKPRRDRGGLEPKARERERGDGEITDCTENRLRQRTDGCAGSHTGTRPFNADNTHNADTDRCNNEYVYVYSKYEQTTKQG